MKIYDYILCSGSGNRFLLFDTLRSDLSGLNIAAFAAGELHRFGVDGLLLLTRDGRGRFGMRMFNTDGWEAEMCGNGIRCVARLARERYPEATGERFAVTSGGYQRYFTGPDGTVYQHILDPKTGYPVESDLLSVSILCDNGTMADAYSTALYVMGWEAAQDFWRQNGGFDMVLITKDGQVLYTPGLADKLTETEGSGYAYASIEP